MRSPLEDGAWLELASVDSTQDAAANLLRLHDDAAVPGVIMTTDQTAGRGRFGRKWHGDPGDSLAMSLVMKAYRDHPKPYLIGMAVAVAA
ncbi:MAG: hypothetical protein HY248_03635, partial [Fimbriimonas ginsengisoli]|nr:hypothetical protein [Fimbriimonas ginsengisoli]